MICSSDGQRLPIWPKSNRVASDKGCVSEFDHPIGPKDRYLNAATEAVISNPMRQVKLGRKF